MATISGEGERTANDLQPRSSLRCCRRIYTDGTKRKAQRNSTLSVPVLAPSQSNAGDGNAGQRFSVMQVTKKLNQESVL